MGDGYIRESDDENKQFGCKNNQEYIDRYLEEGQEPPKYYDPRCRGWYSMQYKKPTSTFSNVYNYANGRLGVTNCVPLWSSDNTKYYGAYCLDQYPTSDTNDFVSHYFKTNDQSNVNYLIFNEDEEFKQGNFTRVKSWIENLVFKGVYYVEDIQMQEIKVD